MKKLIQSLAFACLSLCVITSYGADQTPAEKEAEKKAEKAAELNHIALKDGKLWVMKDGQTTELTETVTLNDGTRVMKDGSYIEQGKTATKMLKQGEAITWEGKVTDHEKVMKDIEKHKEKMAEKAAKDAEKEAKQEAKEAEKN